MKLHSSTAIVMWLISPWFVNTHSSRWHVAILTYA